ncbi:hypothetical protein FHT38_002916 [Mitsuaria sp. BK041]|jgi:hypothetical protein|nr:hypothetical protein [Mitsuaria sp. BK041]MBB3294277.1 hypothetical protein [Mitsuaria sp. BK041]
MSRKKLLKNKRLSICDAGMTGNMACGASIGAAVEFPTRAIAGFAHD